MRAFLAMELPDAVRGALQNEVRRLRGAGARASWVGPEQMHLTLRFLGDITESQRTSLSRQLERICADYEPVRLAVSGLGAFPNPRRPSVVWAGVRLMAGELNALQWAMETAVRASGLAPEGKPFHPHITLARIRDLGASSGLVSELAASAGEPARPFGDAFEVKTVALFGSELKPGGPFHTRLEEYCLSCSRSL